MSCFLIKPGNLDDPRVIALLAEHLRSMEHTAPAESRHALDLEGLRQPTIQLWCVWAGEELAGIGALKRLDLHHAEIKSMRTADRFLRQGAGRQLLQFLIDRAKNAGYARLSLETGSMAYFEPARQLYAGLGFITCKPFADYRDDPLSTFMTRKI